MTYVTNRNASVLLVPVAVYVGMGDPAYLSRESFLFRGDTQMPVCAEMQATFGLWFVRRI